MVDGHPVFSPVFANFNINIFPITSIVRIEVVRRPVSVMYGTNALTGAINIITRGKQSTKIGDSAEFNYLGGSYALHQGEAVMEHFKDDLYVGLTATYRDENGYPAATRGDQDENGIGDPDLRRTDEWRGVLGKAQWGDLSISTFASESVRRGSTGVLPTDLFAVPRQQAQLFYFDAQYDRDVMENSSFHVQAFSDYHNDWYTIENGTILENVAFGSNFPVSRGDVIARGVKSGIDTYLHYNELEDFNLTVGLASTWWYNVKYYATIPELDDQFARISPWEGDRSIAEYSGYLNGEYFFSESFRAVGGIRLSENNTVSQNVSYRTGLIYGGGKGLTVKALWGTAYRAPSFIQLFNNAAPILSGSTDLDPEEMRGLDLQVLYAEESYRGSVTFYMNDNKNTIQRESSPRGPQYVNGASSEVNGVELELAYTPLESLKLFANGTIITQNDEEDSEEDLLIMENWVNVGATFSHERISSTLVARFLDTWGDADSYQVANFTMRYSYDEPIDFLRAQGINLFFTVNNIFDEEYEFAEYVRNNIATIPGGADRNFLGGISLQF